MSQGYLTAKHSSGNASSVSNSTRRRLTVSKPNPSIRDDDDDGDDAIELGSSNNINSTIINTSINTTSSSHLSSPSLDDDDIIKDVRDSCWWSLCAIRISLCDFYYYITDVSRPGNFVGVVSSIVIVVCMVYIIQGIIYRTNPNSLYVRNRALHLGMIDITSSGLYDILLPPNDETPPPMTQGDEGPSRGVNPKFCSDRYLKCEYYWANDTTNASDLDNTPYCSMFICKVPSPALSLLLSLLLLLLLLSSGNDSISIDHT